MTDDLPRREAANRHVNPGDDWPECWPDAPERTRFEAEPVILYATAAIVLAGVLLWSIAK